MDIVVLGFWLGWGNGGEGDEFWYYVLCVQRDRWCGYVEARVCSSSFGPLLVTSIFGKHAQSIGFVVGGRVQAGSIHEFQQVSSVNGSNSASLMCVCVAKDKNAMEEKSSLSPLTYPTTPQRAKDTLLDPFTSPSQSPEQKQQQSSKMAKRNPVLWRTYTFFIRGRDVRHRIPQPWLWVTVLNPRSVLCTPDDGRKKPNESVYL